MKRLLIVDVIPGRWPDPSHLPALDTLMTRIRIAAVSDAQASGVDVWTDLERDGLAGYFERIGTAVDLGRSLDAVAVRRLAGTLGVAAPACVVATVRSALASALEGSGIDVRLMGEGDDLAGVVDSITR